MKVRKMRWLLENKITLFLLHRPKIKRDIQIINSNKHFVMIEYKYNYNHGKIIDETKLVFIKQ